MKQLATTLFFSLLYIPVFLAETPELNQVKYFNQLSLLVICNDGFFYGLF